MHLFETGAFLLDECITLPIKRKWMRMEMECAIDVFVVFLRTVRIPSLEEKVIRAHV